MTLMFNKKHITSASGQVNCISAPIIIILRSLFTSFLKCALANRNLIHIFAVAHKNVAPTLSRRYMIRFLGLSKAGSN